MPVQMIINQASALPIDAQFNSPGDEPMYLEVTGTVWTQSSNELIGIEIAIDGQPVGVAQVFSNGSSTHRAVVPAYIEVQLGEGAHVLNLSVAANTISDNNDFYTAVLHY
jgi:hypothetical protein